ncbi:hypothetical protein CEXT_608231 [Caerostris extrusa]|uniref:Uncharacterized protein n=1 Tax=Caerostris extrusa TaxID=172846 RepID=A0AAV4TCD8_CAEEX|nr:hypothetical protein CEXT_608231 [Caerostris extrusa]
MENMLKQIIPPSRTLIIIILFMTCNEQKKKIRPIDGEGRCLPTAPFNGCLKSPSNNQRAARISRSLFIDRPREDLHHRFFKLTSLGAAKASGH